MFEYSNLGVLIMGKVRDFVQSGYFGYTSITEYHLERFTKNYRRKHNGKWNRNSIC